MSHTTNWCIALISSIPKPLLRGLINRSMDRIGLRGLTHPATSHAPHEDERYSSPAVRALSCFRRGTCGLVKLPETTSLTIRPFQVTRVYVTIAIFRAAASRFVREAKLKARNADQKVAKLIRKNPWMEPGAMTQGLLKVRAELTSIEEKRRKVIRITDAAVKALEPHVACGSGCSYCCHMNTIIYEHEAKRLAEVSGRKMTAVPYRPPNVVFSEGMQYNFMPCPFLVADKCSVYDDRPLVCRVHHSLSNDASDCDPFGDGLGRPQMYDPDIIEVPYKLLNDSANPMEPMGNIAEFFPDET
ncbi:conserved hypothetical protein [Ricinus communis]|uniref:YkgJ family cysteine cluster protein n=1 Tax=Ricinus communis TaxID=3988 RepID=B9TIX9_RICCO|nr:conserved hypothetical protein [Ricinus communis]